MRFIFLISFLIAKVYLEEVEDLFNGLYKDHKIYSGYLDTGVENHKLYYVYTPSQSNTPDEDPLILWIHGGPGCSGMEALIVEIGPVVTDPDQSELYLNPYSWNKLANVIYIDSPAGVGFSLNKDQDWSFTSDQTGKEIVYAMNEFFKEFPQLKENDFYISGFSYAGAYVPFIVKQYYEQTEFKLNLKGIFIGNAFTSSKYDGERSLVDFCYSHGIIDSYLMKEFKRNCPNEDYDNGVHDPRNVTKRCNEIRKNIKSLLQGNDIYGIYHFCHQNTDGFKDLELDTNSMESFAIKALERIRRKNIEEKYMKAQSTLGEEKNSVEDLEVEVSMWPSACQNPRFFSDFLNKEENQKKLHVDPELKQWFYCHPVVYQKYKDEETISLYEPFLFKNNLRVWHFSGDSDGCLPTIGTMKWIKEILKLEVKETWRQWHCDNQVAGFLQGYEKNFALISFKGAGHKVPSDKRKEMFLALQGFLKGELPE